MGIVASLTNGLRINRGYMFPLHATYFIIAIWYVALYPKCKMDTSTNHTGYSPLVYTSVEPLKVVVSSVSSCVSLIVDRVDTIDFFCRIPGMPDSKSVYLGVVIARDYYCKMWRFYSFHQNHIVTASCVAMMLCHTIVTRNLLNFMMFLVYFLVRLLLVVVAAFVIRRDDCCESIWFCDDGLIFLWVPFLSSCAFALPVHTRTSRRGQSTNGTVVTTRWRALLDLVQIARRMNQKILLSYRSGATYWSRDRSRTIQLFNSQTNRIRNWT